MRKFIWIMLAIITLQACDQNTETYNMTVDLEGTEGKWVKLMARVDREYVTHDSALADAGSPAVLTKGIDGVNTMYLTVDDVEGSIQMLVDNSNYTLTGTMDDPVILTDSKAQSDLNAYNEKIRPITDKMEAMVAELRKGPDAENPESYDALRDSYYSLREEKSDIDSVYIEDNPSSFATVLLLRNTFYMLETDDLGDALARLDAPLQVMEEYKYMYGKLERMKAVAIGKQYIDFGLESPEGEFLKVSDVHNGSVLLIDFWASWCGPCRNVNPEVVEIYNTYHDKGFNILGVSLDRDSASWVEAIADDQLTWDHISDLKFWNSEGAILYGVPAIPHTVLIDRDGTIIAKNLHGDALREAIEELL